MISAEKVLGSFDFCHHRGVDLDDLTNKFTLNRSTGCLRLKEVKTKE